MRYVGNTKIPKIENSSLGLFIHSFIHIYLCTSDKSFTVIWYGYTLHTCHKMYINLIYVHGPGYCHHKHSFNTHNIGWPADSSIKSAFLKLFVVRQWQLNPASPTELNRMRCVSSTPWYVNIAAVKCCFYKFLRAAAQPAASHMRSILYWMHVYWIHFRRKCACPGTEGYRDTHTQTSTGRERERCIMSYLCNA